MHEINMHGIDKKLFFCTKFYYQCILKISICYANWLIGLCDLNALIEVYSSYLIYVLFILFIYLFASCYICFCLFMLLIYCLLLMLLLLVHFLIHSVVVVLVFLRVLLFCRSSVLCCWCCHCVLESCCPFAIAVFVSALI